MYQIGFSLSETFRKRLTFGSVRVNIWTNRMLSIQNFMVWSSLREQRNRRALTEVGTLPMFRFRWDKHPTRPKISDPSGKNSITYFTAFFKGYMKFYRTCRDNHPIGDSNVRVYPCGDVEERANIAFIPARFLFLRRLMATFPYVPFSPCGISISESR